MKKRKIDKKEVTWWVYLVILITLVIYGFWVCYVIMFVTKIAC